MQPTIEILISSPLSGSEAAALRDLAVGVAAPALILANFEVVSAGSAHQIDFVVITQNRAELIELKNITAPVKGGVNGPWQIETSPRVFVPYVGPNPWEQARDAKLALSDAMHEYARTRPSVPQPARRRYFEQFDASVSVYPLLMPGSQVCAGNYKAWVRSFPDTLHSLNSRPLPLQTTWKIGDWRQFATDYLGLVPASLSQAIDPAVFRANQLVAEYAAKLRRSQIPPLLPALEQEMVGQNMIEKLRGSAHILLLGRSGLGKSLHLEHYRRACFEFDEVPILLHGRYYQRDLHKAIYKSIAPFTSLSPAELLDAAKQLGRRPVLIVDGWNECPEHLQADLGNDLAAFQLRYDARLVTAAKTVPQHELFATVTKAQIDPLRDEHKRAIFAYHAGVEKDCIPAHCYQQFSTAFDITVAGRCQSDHGVPETRAELYESYVRSAVPSLSARAVLRELAWYMGENLKPILSLGDFERLVEQFVREMNLTLSIADELLVSRLLAVDRDTVAFEHELLKEYFRAEQFLRHTTPERVPTTLKKPRYAGLAEFVIPRLSDDSLIRELLSKADTPLLGDAFRGGAGTAAKKIVREECQSLLTQCRDRLPDMKVVPLIGQLEDGRRFVSSAEVVGSPSASDRERQLCAVVAGNLDDNPLRQDFLELLDLGEWAIKDASERAGREIGIKPKAILREATRGNVVPSHTGQVHPLLFLCHLILEGRRSSSRGQGVSPIRDALLNKVHEDTCGTLGLLLLTNELRYSDYINCNDVLQIARQAWDAGFQMEALDFIHSNASRLRNAGGEAEAAVINLLDTFDVKGNIFLSSQWLETRSSLSGFEIGMDANDALEEFRRILRVVEEGDDPLFQLERESNPSMTFIEFAATWTSSALGKIFEDVFQGAYYEGYELLSGEERKKLLTLALHEPHISFFADWYLGQLSQYGFEGAEELLTRYGGRIDPESFCPQDVVACFVMANQAWAQIDGEPIKYQDKTSEDHLVWGILGELIFWLSRKKSESSGRIAFLCSELASHPAALPDALRRLERSNWKDPQSASVLEPLLSGHAEAVRDALHESLKFEKVFTGVFRGGPWDQAELFRWIISTLGDIGDRRTVSLLQTLTENTIYGTDAIRAIERIEHRIASSG